MGKGSTSPGSTAMQGGPGRASAGGGLLQLLWERLSQVGLWGRVGRSEGHRGSSAAGTGEGRG